MKSKIIDGCGSWKAGSFWFRIWTGHGIHIQAPWSKPLFSERYGHKKFFPKSGWRIGIICR